MAATSYGIIGGAPLNAAGIGRDVEESRTLLTTSLIQRYDLAAPAVHTTSLLQTYGVNTYSLVTSQHAFRWALNTTYRAAQDHRASAGLSVAVGHVGYTGFSEVTDHRAPYATPLTKYHLSLYQGALAAAHEAPYTSTVPIPTSHTVEYDIAATVAVKADHEALAGLSTAAAHSALYALVAPTRKAHTARYGSGAGATRQAHAARYDMPLLDRVRSQHRVPYGLVDLAGRLDTTPVYTITHHLP